MTDSYFKVEFRALYLDIGMPNEHKIVNVYYRKRDKPTYKEPDKYVIEVWDKDYKEWHRTRHLSLIEFFNWIKNKGNPIEEITWSQWQSELMIEELVG